MLLIRLMPSPRNSFSWNATCYVDAFSSEHLNFMPPSLTLMHQLSLVSSMVPPVNSYCNFPSVQLMSSSKLLLMSSLASSHLASTHCHQCLLWIPVDATSCDLGSCSWVEFKPIVILTSWAGVYCMSSCSSLSLSSSLRLGTWAKLVFPNGDSRESSRRQEFDGVLQFNFSNPWIKTTSY